MELSSWCISWYTNFSVEKIREMVGKAGLDVDPRFYCGMEKVMFGSSEHPSKMFGMELEENGCKITGKLK